MRQWGEGVIDWLDEAAVADGGGLVTALAALARTPARSFTSFTQGTAGTVSLLDSCVRGEISDGLSQVMSEPGLIGRAASDYWRSRTLTDMAAYLYANRTGRAHDGRGWSRSAWAAQSLTWAGGAGRCRRQCKTGDGTVAADWGRGGLGRPWRCAIWRANARHIRRHSQFGLWRGIGAGFADDPICK